MGQGLALLAALTLLLVPTAGCLDGGIDQLWKDLEAQPDYETRSLFLDRIEFSATGIFDPETPPEDPSDAADRWEGNVEIPDGTQSLTVLFTVNFTTPDADEEPLPVAPPNTPDGQITIGIQGPSDDENQTIEYDHDATGGFDFNSPTDGDWTLSFEALGQGTVEWRVHATVPTDT